MTFEQCALELLTHRWIFAKTMPHVPHWYTLRKEWDDAAFVRVVEYMRAHGYADPYNGRKYTAFNVNEHKYWTMGSPLPSTVLINRKPHEYISPYDVVARDYDTLFSDADSLRENALVMSMIPAADSVLDIGCGSGLYLDYCTPARYTGIDPSRAMLDSLQAKHAGAHTVHTKFEWYCGDHVNLAVSLFGAANYIDPATLARLPAMCDRYFVMFYRPGYRPVCYERAGVAFYHYEYSSGVLPGDATAFNNFIIVQGGR